MKPALTLPSIMLDADGRIDQDLFCIECAYNLRGLAPTGQCPECGRAIEESLKQNLLSYGDPWWLGRLAVGTRMAFHGALWLTVLPFVLYPAVFVLESIPLAHSVLLKQATEILSWLVTTLVVALAGTTLIGLWLIGGADPAGVRMGQRRSLAERSARPLVILAGVSWLALFSRFYMSEEWMPFVAVAASLVAWAACAAVLGSLARRVPLLPLAKAFALLSRLVVWLTVVIAMLLSVLFTVYVLLDGGSGTDGVTEQVLMVGSIGAAVGWFALNVWYLVLLGRGGKRIRAVAIGVRQGLNSLAPGADQLDPADQAWRQEVACGLRWVIVGLSAALLLWVGVHVAVGNVMPRGLMPWQVGEPDMWESHYWYEDKVNWWLFRNLCSLSMLLACCGGLRSTGLPWALSGPAESKRQLRLASRICLAGCALLTVLGSSDVMMWSSRERSFVPPLTALLTAVGWAVLAVYLLRLAQEIGSRRLVRWMSAAVCVSLVSGLLWLLVDVRPIEGPLSLLQSSQWMKSGDLKHWWLPFGVSLVLQGVWLVSLIVSAGLMYRALRRKMPAGPGIQPDGEPLRQSQVTGT